VRRLEPNDYVIWQRKKLCQIVKRLPPCPGPLFGGGSPPPGAYLDIMPYGVTKEGWAEMKDDVARFRLLDLGAETEFDAEGYDLLGPVNAMEVIAMMAKNKDGEDERGREDES